MSFSINVNGTIHYVDVDGDTPLLWVLRDVLGMTGTEFGCGMALCGACTVHIDGVATRSCITSVDSIGGSVVTTIEAIGKTPSGEKIQKAWIDREVPQCGYCQSGQIMSGSALLATNPHPSDRISAGLDDKGRPVAWSNRFAGSSVMALWAPPFFQNGLDPDTTEGAIDLVYDLPNFHVEYGRVEPPGIPTAFWRSVGPSHNVFVTESFIDEMAAAAKQDHIAYRKALLNKSPRAMAVLDLAAEKTNWGRALPKGIGRGVALQFVFGCYLAQIAEVEVSKSGDVRLQRFVCAVDCGTVVNPDTVQEQIQSGIVFGASAALYGEITLKNGRIEQSKFDTYRVLRINEAPAIEVYIVQSSEPPGGIGETGTSAIVPAISNAIFAATGKRLRKMPADPNVLKQAT